MFVIYSVCLISGRFSWDTLYDFLIHWMVQTVQRLPANSTTKTRSSASGISRVDTSFYHNWTDNTYIYTYIFKKKITNMYMIFIFYIIYRFPDSTKVVVVAATSLSIYFWYSCDVHQLFSVLCTEQQYVSI